MPTFLGHPFRVAIATAKACALLHVAFAHGYSAAPGWGPSMLPTFLVDGQWFVVERGARRGRGVAVGDCVLYAIPFADRGGGGGGEGGKRVMGRPGDYVLLNSPGARSESMMQVPPGHCYITGDNLPWSRDSRDFGPLPMALIKGRVTHTMTVNGWWPPDWFAGVKNGLVPVTDPPGEG
ncbi:hypothetical protein DL764_001841 [Monosporascus ibericus]|uniref:Peptidase S26 domain-containing protein n=1 Tax=Monosporascus ibericus TaxID=155417 RepID=A0A4Q4TSD2_9PEZI|nr:hypothetical protein DL764_001841 [Monosporascus ibericus]